MAVGDLTQGRRVEHVEQLEQHGDYCLKPNGDGEGLSSLWFILPRDEPFVGVPFNEHVIPHLERFWKGTQRIGSVITPVGGGEPTVGWEITEEPDGAVTASPSILTSTTYLDSDGNQATVRWHGYLEHGVWREV